MDPPEVHVTITAPCGVPSGPAFPTPTIKTTCRGGPIAVAFGFHRPCRSEGTKKPESLPESWEQSRARARRGSKGGPGKSRERHSGVQGE